MPLDFAAKMTPAAPPAADPAPEAAETTEEPTQASEGSDTEPAVAGGSAFAEGEEEVQEEAEADEWDDEREFLLDGKRTKAKELREGRLRQEDYTRKTQALAEDRKKLTAEKDEAIEARDEMLDWVKSFQDPQKAMFQIRRNFPETWDALRDYIINEALEEQEMDPKTVELKRKNEQLEIDKRGREEDEEYTRKRSEKQEFFQKTAQLSQTYSGWINSAMTESGLDPKNERHDKMLRAHIRSEFGKEKWTEDHFKRAAAWVAESLGISKKKEAAKLPPVKATSAKPPVQRQAKPKKQAPTSSGDFFERLRRSNGLA